MRQDTANAQQEYELLLGRRRVASGSSIVMTVSIWIPALEHLVVVVVHYVTLECSLIKRPQ